MGLYDRDYARSGASGYAAHRSETQIVSFVKETYKLFAASMLAGAVGAYVGIPLAASIQGAFLPLVILEFVLMFAMFAVKNKPGINLLVMFAFTFMTGITTAPLLAYTLNMAGGAAVVGNAFAMTSVIFGGMSFFAIKTTKDFTGYGKPLMIALIVIASLGSSLPVLIITLALIDATRVFRVARALAMNIVVSDFVEAARVRGEGLRWIMWREIMPNALGPLAAEFGIRFTYNIIFMSALGFLGLGMQPPHADLGLLIRENLQGLLFGSFAPLYPALIISLITISMNIFVDWYLQQLDSALPHEF